jgi:hypothetical protein
MTDSESMFGNVRHRTMKLEDGEQVVRLVGGGRAKDGWPSDKPHAGMWGEGVAYLLVPSGSATRRRVRALLEAEPGLSDRSGDREVLVTGPTQAIARLLESGPPFARVRLRRVGGDASRLIAYRFPAAAEKAPE